MQCRFGQTLFCTSYPLRFELNSVSPTCIILTKHLFQCEKILLWNSTHDRPRLCPHFYPQCPLKTRSEGPFEAQRNGRREGSDKTGFGPPTLLGLRGCPNGLALGPVLRCITRWSAHKLCTLLSTTIIIVTSLWSAVEQRLATIIVFFDSSGQRWCTNHIAIGLSWTQGKPYLGTYGALTMVKADLPYSVKEYQNCYTCSHT